MSEWLDLAKGVGASLKSDVDWALASLGGVAIGGADAYWNILAPVFFDPTMSAATGLIVIGAGRTLWTAYRRSRSARSKVKLIEDYVEKRISHFANQPVHDELELEFRLAQDDYDRLQLLRARLEALSEAELAEAEHAVEVKQKASKPKAEKPTHPGRRSEIRPAP